MSTKDQRADLDRQVERLVTYATARGYQVVVIVREVASGVNDQRPRLTKLLRNPDWGTLVVEHKDRLTRVGFNWFEVLLENEGRRVDVMVPATDDTSDLMTDFMSVVYSFAARLYGLRSAKRRTDQVKAVLGVPLPDGDDPDPGGSS